MVKLFRPQGERKDLLFLLTERYKFCVLEFDEAKGKSIGALSILFRCTDNNRAESGVAG